MNGERVHVNGEARPKTPSQTQRSDARPGFSERPHADDRHQSGRISTPSKITPNGKIEGDYPQDQNCSRINGTVAPSIAPLDLIDQDAYLPIARLIERTAQTCWNGLSSLVDQLSNIPIPPQPPDPSKPSGANNNQTKSNLDKKDRILNFANDQKAVFIKLLVLLQWSKGAEDVTKTIELNYWLMQRRLGYWDAIQAMARLKNDAVGFQLPNPDLQTAAQILSTGRALCEPDLGYAAPVRLSPRQILKVLHRLNRQLALRLTLDDQLPPYLQVFHIHDGRATFIVQDEFELDMSIMNEDSATPFRVLDVRFLFTPAPLMTVTLHSELERYGNLNIDRAGLEGVYDFLHDLTLSCKLSEFYKQAVGMSRSQWSGNLRIEFLHRILVIQYWTNRPIPKSWIEIGIRSGRLVGIADAQPDSPVLSVRWMMEGHLVTDLDLDLDLRSLNLEAILHQVTARHANRILGAIYDRFMRVPIFASGDSYLEQDISLVNPNDCSLLIQLGSQMEVKVCIDPVVGCLTLSPGSRLMSTLQSELNDSKNPIDEFVPKVLVFRAMFSESEILPNINSTSWDHLAMFRLDQQETKALFGSSSTRLNVYRQRSWPTDYCFVISHNSSGDFWSLLQYHTADRQGRDATMRSVCRQRILHTDNLSPLYLERLASFLTGVIFLQMEIAELEQRGQKYYMRELPRFENGCKLPTLSFHLDLSGESSDSSLLGDVHESGDVDALVQATPETPMEQSFSTTVELLHQMTTGAENTFVTAKINIPGKASVLQHLIQAELDSSVAVVSEVGLMTFAFEARFSEPVVNLVINRALHLWDIYDCIDKVKSLPSMMLRRLSMKDMVVCYHKSDALELLLDVRFSSAGSPLQVQFLPEDTNPHGFLTTQLTKGLQNKHRGLAKNISNILSSLTITLPLVSYLRKLQLAVSDTTTQNSLSDAIARHESLCLHVLARKPTVFALQYFSSVPQIPRDVLGPESHPRLLARFEIFPQTISERTMWLVRPAIEEFDSYTRSSYASGTLRTKLRQEMFAKQTAEVPWLRMDTAAACPAEHPEVLLGPIHELIVQWVRDAAAGVIAEPLRGPEPAPTNIKTAHQPDAKPIKPTGMVSSSKAGSKAPGQIQMPNGITNFMKQNQRHGGSNSTANKTTAAQMKGREVITLD